MVTYAQALSGEYYTEWYRQPVAKGTTDFDAVKDNNGREITFIGYTKVRVTRQVFGGCLGGRRPHRLTPEDRKRWVRQWHKWCAFLCMTKQRIVLPELVTGLERS